MIRSAISTTLFLGLVLLMSCGKDSPSPMNCSTNSERVIAAAETYGKSPTKANCEAYKNVVNDFYKSCATFYTGSAKEAMDEFLAEPCPN